MDETPKLVCVPENWLTRHKIAAAPTTHVAVKRELLERVAAHCKVMYRAPDDAENFERHSIEAELRALLSQKGE